MTVRRAWTMRLKPGAAAQYQAAHDALWPEMRALMARNGVRSFSIYRHDLTLFAYQERDAAAPTDAEPDPIIRRWWTALAPLIDCHPDHSPVREALDEVFHFEAGPPLEDSASEAPR